MRVIEADYNKIKGTFNRYASFCVGAGRAAEALRMDFQKHLDMAVKECGFKYLRCHGIFHEDMAVYTEDREGNPVYNWQYVDLVYDSLLEKGIKPFVEVSFMPYCLASGDKTVFWWKANVTPPRDYDRWYELVNRFVHHLEDRYGREEVATWYFEVWNEPNHPAFYSSTMEEYFKLYTVTCKAIKDVYRGYRVGGPASAGNAWVTELIEYCSLNKVELDFVSTHIYGVRGDFDEFGDSVLYLIEDQDYLVNAVKRLVDSVRASSMPDLEIHYTEWSSSYSSRDAVHDSYIQAPYILYNLKRLEGLVSSMSYWTFTDVFEEVGPPPSHFHGGFGLINLQGLKKPSFYAYKFINELGDLELCNEDSDSWVCRSEEGIQVLVWNYTKHKQDECNSRYFKKDLVPGESDEVKLVIRGLPKKRYFYGAYLTGYDANDVYTAYLKLGSPDTLKREEVRLLDRRNSCSPVETGEASTDENGTITINFKLRENDVYLIKLRETA